MLFRIELIFIMYAINVLIFIYLKNDFINKRTNKFFEMLKGYKIQDYNFIRFFEEFVIFKGSFIMIIISLIFYIKGVVFG